MPTTNQDTIGETNISKIKGASIFGISLILAIWFTIASPENGLGAFISLLFLFLFLGFLVGTEGGRKAAKKAIEDMQEEMENQNGQQQQQQVGGKSSSEPTQVCSECGWKNPKNNNYCHDCGSELDG